MNLPDIPGLFEQLKLLQPFSSHRATLKVAAGCLEAAAKDLNSGEDVLREIEKFAGGHAEGWACFAQGLQVGIGNAQLPRDMGLLLSAEFVQRTADGTDPISLHVRHLGSCWRLTTLTKKTVPQSGFLVPHSFLSSRAPADGRSGTLYLDYEVFWESQDESQPFRATLSRFTGFSTQDK